MFKRMSIDERVMPMDYTLSDITRPLLNSLGGSVNGLKKIMKLLFLAQYEFKMRRTVIKHFYNGKPIIEVASPYGRLVR
mgnify:CR=1 FL=1